MLVGTYGGLGLEIESAPWMDSAPLASSARSSSIGSKRRVWVMLSLACVGWTARERDGLEGDELVRVL